MMSKAMNGGLRLYDTIRAAAALGNALYFFWILYNGFASGFAARGVRLVSYIGILVLLVVNLVLLLSSERSQKALKPLPSRDRT